MGSMKHVAPIDGMMFATLMKKWVPSVQWDGSYQWRYPIKNWAGSSKDYNRSYYSRINSDLVIKREYRKYHCYSCIVGCGASATYLILGR